MEFFYTVTCRIIDPALKTRWLGWLEREHIADVLHAGARSADIVRRDGPDLIYDIHYRFKDRAAYDGYIETHAPRLREQGAQLFPDGLIYERSSGDIIFSRMP